MKKFFNHFFFLYLNMVATFGLLIFFIYLKNYKKIMVHELTLLHNRIEKQSKVLDELHTTYADAKVWVSAGDFFHKKKSEPRIKELAHQNHIDFLEYSESLRVPIGRFAVFCINKITFCLSFSVKNDDNLISFIKKLKHNFPGFIFSRFIYLEKNYHKQTKIPFLKGNYYFECYYIEHTS